MAVSSSLKKMQKPLRLGRSNRAASEKRQETVTDREP